MRALGPFSALSLSLLLSLGAGCAGAVDASSGADEPFTSAAGNLLDFRFTGELATTRATSLTGQIRSQLFFAIGQLNAEPGVPQLGKLKVSNVRTRWVNGLLHVTYDASLPVAWSKERGVPSRYTLVLPLRTDAAGQQAFYARYQGACNDGESGPTLGNFWYHYRPSACTLADGDVTRAEAEVTPSPRQTSGKYPEYHRLWADNRLSIVAIFGKYEKGATGLDDAGIAAYVELLSALRARFPGATTTPALPARLDGSIPDVVFQVARPDGTRLEVTAILVDELASAGATFDARFNRLTPGADLVLYNGHAGLGANVRSLASRGQFFPGQYQLWFLNGCDTFAYDAVDILLGRRAALNPDDAAGTKYTDTVTNAMPAYFHSLTTDVLALVDGLASEATPKTYEALLGAMDDVQIAVVDGEQDNVFSPSYDPGTAWNGLGGDGTVGYREVKSFQTELLQPGRYVFQLTHDPAQPAGDADLRVRVGAPPTGTLASERATSLYKNTNERAVVTLAQPGRIFLTVTGDSTTASRFRLDGWQAPQ